MNGACRLGLALAAFLSGCAAPARPRTAREIASAYGDLEGEAVRLVESGEADRLLEAGRLESRTRTEGEGRGRIEVKEWLVLGEPWRIEVKGRRWFDPIAAVPEGEVARIVYGQKPEEGLEIRVPAEVREVLRVLRTESSLEFEDGTERSARLSTGNIRFGSVTKRDTLRAHGCSLGLWLHKADGGRVYLSGHAKEGVFNRFDNRAIFEVLRRIAARQGKALDE